MVTLQFVTLCEVPNVVLKRSIDADFSIEIAGLVPRHLNSGKWVASQSPDGGTLAHCGSTVSLRMGPGDPP